MSNRKLFQGLIFAFAGTQSKPEQEIRTIISQYAGSIAETVSDKVTHVLSSDEMASVLGSSHKLQFFPEFETQVATATMYSVPIVSGHFLQACIDAGKIVDIGPFLIFGSLTKEFTAQSKLDARVQDLVRLIFDKTSQQQAILEMNLDSSKIVNVTQSTISSAYKVLSDIEKAIQLKSIKRSQDEAQKKIARLVETVLQFDSSYCNTNNRNGRSNER